MAKSDLISAAWKFAALVRNQKQEDTVRSVNKAIVELQARAAAQGTVLSGHTLAARVEIQGKGSRAVTLAYLDGLLEGCEQSDLAIDDDVESRIVDEVVGYNTTVKSHATKVVDSIPAGLRASMSSTQLQQQLASIYARAADVSRNEVLLAVKRKRLSVKANGASGAVTNIYHLSGTNPRVNVNSSDNSTNVIHITKEEVFAKVREAIATSPVPDEERHLILQRLDDLENSRDVISYSQRMVDLLQVGANVMTVLTPFLPALAEWGRSLVG